MKKTIVSLNIMKTSLLRLSFTIPCLFVFSYVISQPGTLDSSFGINGKVTSNVSTFFSNYTEPIAIQSDGKIITASNTQHLTYESRFSITRYNDNGSIDSTFGNNGKVETYFDTATYKDEYVGCVATSIITQPDNKIVVGGYIFHPFVGPDYFALVRYLPDGKLDSSFGNNGKSKEFIGPFPKENEIYSLALQSDGKIIAGGWSDGYCVVRYKSNGVIDSTFGTNGKIRNQEIRSFGPTTVKLQQDGKIITGETKRNFDEPFSDFEIDRLLPNGIYDSAFGTNGHVFIDFFGASENLYSTVILTDGSIIVAGNTQKNSETGNYAAIVKLNKGGLIDSSFGINGKVATKLGEQSISVNKVLVTDDNKLLISAQTISGDFIVARFNTNGTIDSSFGINGKNRINFGANAVSRSAALQQDGKILIVGTPNISLVRFKGDEPITVSIRKKITVTEGNSGTTPAKFSIILNEPAATSVSVNYTTRNLSAKGSSDFTAKSGTITFTPGAVNRAVTINVKGDNLIELNERFALVLSNPVNAQLGTIDSVICIILNDDPSFTKSARSSDDIQKQAAIKIYPNPVKDILRVEGISNNSKTVISIIDIDGKILSNNTTSASVYSQNIQKLKPGTYFIKIESPNKTETLRFIKQ